MKVAVVGTGYVGLVTGTCLAETGNDVICVDIDTDKVQKMKDGIVPIYEPGLEALFERNIKQGRLKFTANLKEAIAGVTIIFLALPTPPGEDGSADLSYILGVAEEVGKIITDYKIIIDKSTVPVGTADKVHAAIAKNTNIEFDVVSNPEFLREGYAIEDFMKPDRVVIGLDSERAQKELDHLYRPFVRQGNPILYMDKKSAELTKYAANAFLATKITFMNEIANVCELVGADVDKVRIGIGSDDRIGKRFLFPGIGYGGSCFPKDVQALMKSSKEVNYDFQILNAVMDVNHRQKTMLVPRMKKHFDNNLKGKTIAIWGLAFKPNTDDMRDSSSLSMIPSLIKKGAKINYFDPTGKKNDFNKIKNVTFSNDIKSAIAKADLIIIHTEWNDFKSINFKKDVKNKNYKIFDMRNIYSPKKMKELKIKYFAIGC